nr:unnamed protein product [Callosobruchus chinensis]
MTNDDTSVVVSAATPNELLRIIQVVKDEMNEWCQANRFILNKNRTYKPVAAILYLLGYSMGLTCFVIPGHKLQIEVTIL